jgi:hypothetical protein
MKQGVRILIAHHFDSNFTQGTEQIVSYDKVLGKL